MILRKSSFSSRLAWTRCCCSQLCQENNFLQWPNTCNPRFSWDISHGLSGWFFSCEIWLSRRLLWYVGLQAKNIHCFWNVIITVENRLFFHGLTRFCHFSNKLILSLLWHPYSLVLFWYKIYIYILYIALCMNMLVYVIYIQPVLLSQGNHSHSCGGISGRMCQVQPVHCQTSLWHVLVRFPSSPNKITAPPGWGKMWAIQHHFNCL